MSVSACVSTPVCVFVSDCWEWKWAAAPKRVRGCPHGPVSSWDWAWTRNRNGQPWWGQPWPSALYSLTSATRLWPSKRTLSQDGDGPSSSDSSGEWAEWEVVSRWAIMCQSPGFLIKHSKTPHLPNSLDLSSFHLCSGWIIIRRKSWQSHPRWGQRCLQPADISRVCLGQRPPQWGGGPPYDEHPQRAVPTTIGNHTVCARRVWRHCQVGRIYRLLVPILQCTITFASRFLFTLAMLLLS